MIKGTVLGTVLLCSLVSVFAGGDSRAAGDTPPDNPVVLDARTLFESTGAIPDYRARIPILDKCIEMLGAVVDSVPSMEAYRQLAEVYAAKAWGLAKCHPDSLEMGEIRKSALLSAHMFIEAAKLAPNEEKQAGLELHAADLFSIGGDWKRAHEIWAAWKRYEPPAINADRK